jgi:hypothetical protein
MRNTAKECHPRAALAATLSAAGPVLESFPTRIRLHDRFAKRRLYRPHPVTKKRRSLRQIATLLEREGYLNSAGNRFSAASVARMVG